MSTRLQTPLPHAAVRSFSVGDVIYLSGEIYTMRDKAHAKLLSDESSPFDLCNACIYHSGPLITYDNETPRVIAAGPTTSTRMDDFTPALVERGVTAIIGKGGMSMRAAESLRGRCVYLAFTGGCGVLAKEQITKVAGVYYPELGMTEAIWKLVVQNFGPLVVGIDAHGGNVYKEVQARSKEKLAELILTNKTCSKY